MERLCYISDFKSADMVKSFLLVKVETRMNEYILKEMVSKVFFFLVHGLLEYLLCFPLKNCLSNGLQMIGEFNVVCSEFEMVSL